MVRSASMYYCSEAVKFLPDFEDIVSFEDRIRSDPLSSSSFSTETIRAADTLDGVISTLGMILMMMMMMMMMMQ